MQKTTPSQLETHLGYWLRYVSNHVSAAFARKVESEGVTVSEWVVLRTLFDAAPCSPRVLADCTGLHKAPISRLLDRLLQKQLVQRKADPEDARAQIITLTPKGSALVPRLADIADANDAEYFAHLSPTDHKHLMRILRRTVHAHEIKQIPME
jgi:DNA-binding MarR family transcriptional regulator